MSTTIDTTRAEVVLKAGSAKQVQTASAASRRDASLDALRAAMTLLVLFHHTAITYGAIGGWYYHEIDPNGTPSSALLIFFCTVNQAFFMGLFFLIAGYLTPGAVERHGEWGYLRERLLRLGVPILAYSVLIGPTTIKLASYAHQEAAAEVANTVQKLGFGDTLLLYWDLGVFSSGPLWFAAALLVFSFAYVAWRSVGSRLGGRRQVVPRSFPSNATLAAAALVTGAAAFGLRLVWPLGVETIGPQYGYFSTDLGYFASYVVLFAAGCLGASSRWLDNVPERQRRLWLTIALIVMPVMGILPIVAPYIPVLQANAAGGWNIPAAIYAFWEPFVAWGVILGLLQVFKRRFAILGPIGSALGRRAYAMYIIHPPILVGIAMAWHAVEAPALVKFAVTGTVTCILSFWIAGLLLRVRWISQIV